MLSTHKKRGQREIAREGWKQGQEGNKGYTPVIPTYNSETWVMTVQSSAVLLKYLYSATENQQPGRGGGRAIYRFTTLIKDSWSPCHGGERERGFFTAIA